VDVWGTTKHSLLHRLCCFSNGCKMTFDQIFPSIVLAAEEALRWSYCVVSDPFEEWHLRSAQQSCFSYRPVPHAGYQHHEHTGHISINGYHRQCCAGLAWSICLIIMKWMPMWRDPVGATIYMLVSANGTLYNWLQGRAQKNWNVWDDVASM